MNKKHLQILRPAILIGIGLVFAFIGASFDSMDSGADLLIGTRDVALYQARLASPTPIVKAVSQPGSTDQIVLMGFVIVVIVLLPIVFRRKTWMNK